MILTFLKKGFPFYYFGRLIYRKNSGNVKDYFSTREYYRVINSKKLNNEVFNSIMRNKLIFSMFCEKNNLPISKIWSYNFNNTFYFQGKSFYINNKDRLFEYFHEVFENSGKNHLFLKPFSNKGGRGIFLLDIDNLEVQLDENGDKILNSYYIHEEVIQQHSEINKIYSKSLNTLRITTYLDENGTLHFLDTFMRIGSGGSVLDNISSGGFYVPIHSDRGTLTGTGYQALQFGAAIINNRHPDTQYPFNDFKIPFFKEAHDLCLQLTKLLPNRLSGWDIAITPNGPYIVEGNDNPYILGGETEYKGFLKHPIYKKIISES
ncbi:hypothetical protein K8352_10530 [Flavobacteriaceae bacterium F89]|uniref:Alpha-L-glutamate ligase-related protein ATP-grasp domain-containing protein n=1 Tax=Cerina litoralis TaxID=2874477 RepID=A0AAE3EVW4_9FLAO|nr:sugar-transfer associated ATP-grasp domain-containing protein [Cerina litoralis]MCG2461184.1 hypothetical protein [Cerina litoralis]